MHINFSQTNFRLFQTSKEFADDNFEFYENGGKFSEHIKNTGKRSADDNFEFDYIGGKFSVRIKNTVGKGELLIMSNVSLNC